MSQSEHGFHSLADAPHARYSGLYVEGGERGMLNCRQKTAPTVSSEVLSGCELKLTQAADEDSMRVLTGSGLWEDDDGVCQGDGEGSKSGR